MQDVTKSAPAQQERRKAVPKPPSIFASTSAPLDMVSTAPHSALMRSFGVRAHSTAEYAPAVSERPGLQRQVRVHALVSSCLQAEMQYRCGLRRLDPRGLMHAKWYRSSKLSRVAEMFSLAPARAARCRAARVAAQSVGARP